MKRNTWESIRLMLWAWELGSGTTLPEGLREVLEKAEELLADAAETDAPAGGGEAPAKKRRTGSRRQKRRRSRTLWRQGSWTI